MRENVLEATVCVLLSLLVVGNALPHPVVPLLNKDKNHHQHHHDHDLPECPPGPLDLFLARGLCLGEVLVLDTLGSACIIVGSDDCKGRGHHHDHHHHREEPEVIIVENDNDVHVQQEFNFEFNVYNEYEEDEDEYDYEYWHGR